MTTVSTSEVLNKAADLIEERGWTTGGGGWEDKEGSGLCLEGGILAAAGFGTQEYTAPQFLGCPAYIAVKSYLGLDDSQALYEWNDGTYDFSGESRSAEDVIATLRATALIESARERESVEV